MTGSIQKVFWNDLLFCNPSWLHTETGCAIELAEDGMSQLCVIAT